VLPLTVTAFVPLWIARRGQIAPHLGGSGAQLAAQAAGIALVAVGLSLFVATLWLFVTLGRGTLAPWDPPKHLVVRGPYRHVRNPMISGVLFVLFGEALILLSRPHLEWAVLFLAINVVYIPLFEEPQLAARFGDSYREYKRHVGRFVPGLRGWDQDHP
jgi:protein-S-isoprenylcysteine O-methyltransferase Ste14